MLTMLRQKEHKGKLVGRVLIFSGWVGLTSSTAHKLPPKFHTKHRLSRDGYFMSLENSIRTEVKTWLAISARLTSRTLLKGNRGPAHTLTDKDTLNSAGRFVLATLTHEQLPAIRTIRHEKSIR